MAGQKMDVGALRRLLRLHLEGGHGPTQIATTTGKSFNTVRKYLDRAKEAGLTTEQLSTLTDAELGRRFLPERESPGERVEPDWARLHLELRRPHVTKQLLWQEYREQYRDGYEYSRFCELYGRWAKCLAPTMRQLHVPGERLLVDFSGGRLAYTDADDGIVKFAKLFIAVLGGSSLTYAEPVADETVATWISCHVHALEFFGGVPLLWVPDNLRAAVTRADRYEPLVNRTYEQVAEYYGASVFPARARKPRDKAQAEAGVLVASRWILAVLRNQRFDSLSQLRQAVRPLLERINMRTMRVLGRSRRELFEQSERGALLPLPAARYEWSEWARATVGSDYHLVFDDHAYSVPHPLAGVTLDIRATTATVEILNGTTRVASHTRARHVGGKTTLPEHMPTSHREYAQWTPERLKHWASTIGPNAAAFVEAVLEAKPHPQHGLRACLGLKSLTRHYPPDRLEAACLRALRVRALSVRSIRSILVHNLDRESLPEDRGPLPDHENIRGPEYFD
jgi:transposase